jgi:hypothetical protein
MEKCDIYERQKLSSLALSVHIQELCSLIDEYLNKFDRKDFFVFSDSEEQNKIFRKEYYAFVSKLPKVMNDADTSAAELSLLLSLADDEGKINMIELIASKTEAYMKFLSDLDEYSRESKTIISSESISPSRLISGARKLKASAETLIDAILADQ